MSNRIVITVTNDLTYDQRVIRIANSLVKHGYKVSLIGRELNSSKPLKKQSFEQKRLRCCWNKGALFYAEYNLRLFLYLAFGAGKMDVICACDLDTALSVWSVSLLRKNKIVFDAHEYFTEVPELEGRNTIKKIWTRIGKLTVPKFNLRYTVNQSLSHILGNKYGVDFKVIRNAPSLNEEKNERELTSAREKNVILYQGALNKGRGVEQAIKALQYLPSMELWLVGEGDLSEELREQAEKTAYLDRIKFFGRMTPEQLKELTPKGTIGLNILDGKSLNYYYSLANKFFDFIHAGVPSINMDFPEYQLINEEHDVCTLVSDLSPKTLAGKIKELVENESLYNEKVKGCLTARQAFNWEKEEKNLIHLYSRLFESNV